MAPEKLLSEVAEDNLKQGLATLKGISEDEECEPDSRIKAIMATATIMKMLKNVERGGGSDDFSDAEDDALEKALKKAEEND
jgi:hypothetical protein